MSEEKPNAAFVTFYSFKGGVGRSMALINTAGILAGRGFHVLVIDLDLEAPGLSYLDPDAPDVSPSEPKPRKRSLQSGFVDLLCDAKQRGEEADLFTLSAKELSERYAQTYRLPDDLGEFKDGSLHIMPAGKFDGSYADRFDSLNLHELYSEGLGEPLIRAFKKKLAESGLYDYVLVDSRTGFSDEAGICTRDLSDYLIILTGLNRQNIEGTCDFLRALRAGTDGKKNFQIVISPVPNGEDALLDRREADAKSAFEEAWSAKVDLSLQIPYHPQLALTEEPHIFRRRRGYLADAYRSIERRLLAALGHDPATLAAQARKAFQQKDYTATLRHLKQIVRLDGGRSSVAHLFLALIGNDEGLDKILTDGNGKLTLDFLIDNASIENPWLAQDLADRLSRRNPSLTDRIYRRIIETRINNAELLWGYARFLDEHLSDLDRAETFYKRAIEADPTNAYILSEFAVFVDSWRGDLDNAEAFHKRAIDADPTDADNLSNYAVFLEYRRGDLDNAEVLYKRAIEAGPKDADSLRQYAGFLARRRGDMERAEALYKRAIEADPKDAYTLGDYGQFLAGLGNFSEGARLLRAGVANVDHHERANSAEFCFSLWLVLRMQGREAGTWESRFKFLIQQGFQRHGWTFDRMLAQAKKNLSPEEFAYANALAAAFLDATKVGDLEQHERWRSLKASDSKT